MYPAYQYHSRQPQVVDKVFRLLVALISTFIHNFDIYIDGTY